MFLHHRFHGLGPAFYSEERIKPLNEQRLVEINEPLAQFLNVDFKDPTTLDTLSGELDIPKCLSMVYAGHQFGGFSPKLGDGRGVLLGELETQNGDFYDLHIKGAGLTPFSRMGDGRAVLRSSIREYLVSEYMHALGIPSSRALALYDSTQAVYRERPELGAMLARVAKTHIRFGHFEYFYYSGKTDELDALMQYCLEHHFPHCLDEELPILSMFQDIVLRTANMIAHWQAVGFQHGVMNTDNFSILGETIDYGPYGFMEEYDPSWVCNHSDHEGRYAFGRQPSVGLWNLNCLARSFSNYLTRDQLVDSLKQYETRLEMHFSRLMTDKMGLSKGALTEELLKEWLAIITKEGLDYTSAFRLLSTVSKASPATLLDEVVDRSAASEFLDHYWSQRDDGRDQNEVSASMLKANPKFVLRNYLAHETIESAEQGNYLPFRKLLNVLSKPFDEHEECKELAMPSPEWGKRLEVSCSS
ncbi:protein adenylyltransferase SelO [Marinomonas mediterranea]|uniref:protein adenylyltransferase SelO n=1 Tax=Marinomonas mediterranea TaxID=119864 RepID=UPI002349858A|nr:YdiU family protein [Marinomonas mediterranea]WCN09455.1 YdiU family protein [Marinomonas mediterranea]